MPVFSFQQKHIHILDAVRTAVGSPFKSLKDFSSGQLGSFVVDALLKRTRIEPKFVEELVLGNTVQAGAGQNPARQSAVLGGLSTDILTYTVNQVCAAGLQSVILGCQSLALGSAHCVMAGGAESATRTPLMFTKLTDAPFVQRDAVDSMIYDGLWCLFSGQHMGQLAESLAKKYKITRQEQDQYSLESHYKAAAGSFEQEIIPVELSSQTIFRIDERIRRRVNPESFANLPPAFAENGTVSSGNASVPSDGAAALLLGNEIFIQRSSVKPLARILGYASIGIDPALTFTAAVPAVQECLKKCDLKIQDIDLFEVSEAFAVQAIFTRNELKINPKKINVFGGDLALGHPLGAVGSRILVTLTHALRTKNKKYGIAVVCYGGGGAIAVAVENEN